MQVIEFMGAVGVLLATVVVGTVAHELSHAVVLHTLGVSYDIEWRPDPDATGGFGGAVFRPMATVTPRGVPPGVSPWALRLAAVAPFVLATPAALVVLGVLPDPVVTGDVLLVAANVAWLGCALPSPQDFSVFWHVERLLDDR